MKYTTAEIGRVFVIRLEDGEILQDSIEEFAKDKKITCAKVQVLGGADKGSKLIVGPQQGRAETIQPMIYELDEMHEIVGNGTIFPGADGNPKLHCHISCGRKEKTLSGDIREGIKVWHVVEVVMTELLDCTATRKKDAATRFELLYPE